MEFITGEVLISRLHICKKLYAQSDSINAILLSKESQSTLQFKHPVGFSKNHRINNYYTDSAWRVTPELYHTTIV